MGSATVCEAVVTGKSRKRGQKQEDQIQAQRTSDRRTGELNGSLSGSARSILLLPGWVTNMRSKTTGAAAEILLLTFCFLSGGCEHYNTPAIRDASFLPYAGAKVGQVSLREFLSARSAVVFEGDQLSVTASGTNHGTVKGTIFGIGSAAAIDRRGYFLTAAHCVQKGPSFLLLFFDKGKPQARPARVVWRGDVSKKQPDLALLQVPFPLQDVFEWTPTFTNGEPIVAAGATPGPDHVINRQCMAGKILRLDTGSETVLPHYTCISHDAPLTFGDSGGPLASTDGRLVGINSDAVIGRPRWLSLSVETLSTDAERPDLEWLRQLIQQDAAAQSGAKTTQSKAFEGVNP
ncbi:MAG: serine protease [Limisphaerales bacterium]